MSEKKKKPTVGHNSGKNPPIVGGVAVDQLKSIISRVERLEEEKAGIAADIRDVFAEAKGNGFDTKAIRQIIKLRKMDASDREEQEAALDTYRRALGMLPLLDYIEEDKDAEFLRQQDPDKVYEVGIEHGFSREYIDKMLAKGGGSDD